MYRSAHLNTLYNIQNNFSGQLLVQSAILARLGMSLVLLKSTLIFLGFAQIADSYCDVVLECYIKCSPADELLRAAFQNAYSASFAKLLDSLLTYFR
jgi:hypothetical protein